MLIEEDEQNPNKEKRDDQTGGRGSKDGVRHIFDNNRDKKRQAKGREQGTSDDVRQNMQNT